MDKFQKVLEIIVIIVIFIIIWLNLSTPTEYNITPSIITLIAFITAILLSQKFEKIDIFKIINFEGKLKDAQDSNNSKKNEIKNLKNENEKLMNNITKITTVAIDSKFQQITNNTNYQNFSDVSDAKSTSKKLIEEANNSEKLK